MKSLWNEAEAAAYEGDLGARVYSSRLLGRDRSLVLHGGGNTSVKVRESDLHGGEEEILYVKGSGWDLDSIEAAGFAPVRLAPARRLALLPHLSDAQMVNELATSLKRSGAPAPSVETVLHAVLPHRFVDHTHADAVVTVTNTPDGAEHVRRIYGDTVVVIPYVMPGFDLARECARRYAAEAGDATVGLILLNHGVFTFGDTAREAYERMIHLVDLAERYLAAHGAWELPEPPVVNDRPAPAAIAALRRDLSQAAGFPLIVTSDRSPGSWAFARRPDAATVSQQGPATPDHVIRTKRLPLLGRDVAAYTAAYEAYFAAHALHAKEAKTRLDPAPRVIVDPELGVLTAARTSRDAVAAGEIYRHTIRIIERAERLGGYRALPAQDLFDMEYWELEQAKLKRAGAPPPFAGQVALVTGAASGIGKACVQALLARGAAVVGLDRDPAICDDPGDKPFLGIHGDVTDPESLATALTYGVDAFGGLDILIANAGIFPASAEIASLGDDLWRRTMQVNLDANLALFRLAYPLLKLAPQGGRVVVVGSKNVPAPGPGVAAYSASKAALVQLARVAALEWGKDNIRVNVVHPNAVFDTAIWTDDILAARAARYGLSVEQYKKNNVLGVEVTSQDVAEVVAELCGPRFAKTTGAQVPVDGGNERVI